MSGVDSPANELDGFMVFKARRQMPSVVEAADALRKALDDDAAFEQIVKAAFSPDELVFFGTQGIYVMKSKHALRHPDTGQFVPMPSAAAPEPAPEFPITHGGAVHPVLARARAMASGKKSPEQVVTPRGPVHEEGALGNVNPSDSDLGAGAGY